MNREVGDLALQRLGLSMLEFKGNWGIGRTCGWFNNGANSFRMGLDDRACRGDLIAGDEDVFNRIGCPVFDGEFGG